jgi:DNA-binding response OmpR family regulator
MIEFVLWLATPDRVLADKWYRLFSRERLSAVPVPDLSRLANIRQDNWGIAFVEVCRECLASPKDLKLFLNGRKNISVIAFSGPGKTSNADIAELLENGADDFITSDIDERVLLSKTKAHIRRLLPNLNLAKTTVTSANGDIEIDRVKRTIRLGLLSGRTRTLDGLTPKEFEIFLMLLSDEEHVVTRKLLMEDIWRDKCGHVNPEAVDKHVEALRHKLGAYGKAIRTVYGSGYVYKSR